jgi:hypothetical protein
VAQQGENKGGSPMTTAATTHEILCGDCLDVLPQVSGARLIFADPPYNIGVDYGDGAKADQLPADQYVAWCRQWVRLCRSAPNAANARPRGVSKKPQWEPR